MRASIEGSYGKLPMLDMVDQAGLTGDIQQVTYST